MIRSPWRMAPHVFAVVGATPENAAKLGRYIALWLEWRRLAIHNNAHGLWRMTRKGQRVTAEYLAEQKASRRMLALGDALGCSPLARAKIRERRERAKTPHRRRGA